MDIALESQRLQDQIEKIIDSFHQHLDINQLLLQLRSILLNFIESLAASLIQKHLRDPDFLSSLKSLAGKSGLRFKGFRSTSIRLLSGESISIDSPYFARATPHRGRRRKKRASKTGCHTGLLYLGFIDRCSGMLASAAVQALLLCPSAEIARETLLSFGIRMDTKTIERFCRHMGTQAIEHRDQIALNDNDSARGRILFVCIDGGRLRERKAKRGRRPAGCKRQGYHTDWREPTQLVIQWLNPDGSKCKGMPPIYDATMADTDAAFELLEDYLRKLDADEADTVIFCADGARRYWSRFSTLARKLGIHVALELIDYTHAKQNLNPIIDKLPRNLPSKQRKAIADEWKNLLWQGKIADLGRSISTHIKARRQRKQALEKFKSYFLDNCRRLQYAAFRYLDLPTGSGCVESAIRRVINLRLKSPGIFWKRETAEIMLFLRSTLLCGRWKIMLKNLLALNRGELAGCH